MREKINNFETILGTQEGDGAEKRFSIELSEKDRKMFKVLDRFGYAGKEFLSQLYDRCLPEVLTAGVDSVDRSFKKEIEFSKVGKLTARQKEFLLLIAGQLENDHDELIRSLRGLSKKDLLKQLHYDLSAKGDSSEFDSEKVSVSVVFGGIAMLVHDRSYFDEKFPGEKSSGGFYAQNEKPDPATKFLGRVFVVDATDSNADMFFRHEYLHVLIANYIEPYEISPILPDDAVVIQKKIDQINQQITELNEEINYVEFDEVLSLQQEIGRMKKQTIELQRRKGMIIDKTENYLTAEARCLFRDVRDELCAYAAIGKFSTKESSLIPINRTWSERIDRINYENDRRKLVEQWGNLKLAISVCKKTEYHRTTSFRFF